MKRVMAILVAVALLASAATAVLVWQLSKGEHANYPEISVYARGQTERVLPYRYCTVDLTECAEGGAEGELSVNTRGPVQLSVPPAIGAAPWRLIRIFEDEAPLSSEFRPDTRNSLTIPTVDPQHGKLLGLVIQVPSKFIGENGDWIPHAEWSVRAVWD
jgi:hypothetical protein